MEPPPSSRSTRSDGGGGGGGGAPAVPSSATTTSTSRRRAATDVDELRRLGEALLLAQNRARVSTDRANRCERMLRTVLSQINLQSGSLLHELEQIPRSASLDSMADWDLLREMVPHPTDTMHPHLNYQFPVLSNDGTATVVTEAPTRAMLRTRSHPHVLVSPSPSSSPLVPSPSATRREQATDDHVEMVRMARRVVMNLHLAARRLQQLEDHGSSQTLPMVHRRDWHGLQRAHRRQTWITLDSNGWIAHCATEYLRPWQFVAGLMVGFAVGAAATRVVVLRCSFAKTRPSLAAQYVKNNKRQWLRIRESATHGCDRVTNFVRKAAETPPMSTMYAFEDVPYQFYAPVEVS